MTRARSELIAALAAALSVVVLLATWQSGMLASDEAAPNTIVAIETDEAGGAVPSVPIVQDTTVLAGPLPGTLHEPPAPEAESAQLENDRAYIAEAFPAISTWQVAELKPLLATTVLDASTDTDLEQVMETLAARLGELQYFDEPEPVEGGEVAEHAADTAAELQPYRFTAWYEAGAAEVNLVLERESERSAVYSFDIHIPN